MTKQAITTEALATRINWTVSLAKLSVGDKLLVHARTQVQIGSCLAKYNKADKRFVSKKVKNGIQVIRVE